MVIRQGMCIFQTLSDDETGVTIATDILMSRTSKDHQPVVQVAFLSPEPQQRFS